MRVLCVRCNEPITQAKFLPRSDGGHDLTVFHHGEEDNMTFPAGWIGENPDFWFMVSSGAVVGRAFVEKDPAEV